MQEKDREKDRKKENELSMWITKPITYTEWPTISSNYEEIEGNLLKLVKGNNIEIGDPSIPKGLPEKDDIFIIDKEEDFQYYAKLMSDKKHYNYVGIAKNIGSFVISIEETAQKKSKKFKCIYRTQYGDERFILEGKDRKKSIKGWLSEKQVDFEKLKSIKNKEIVPELVNFEKQNIVKNYKIGVLYWKEGQTENQAFSNLHESASQEYTSFLEFLGTKIELKGWDKYRGGLNIKDGSTGEHSIYTSFQGLEIMFHVATLLPYHPEDEQKLERKRHLGNDMVAVIFKEGNQPFDPSILTNQFNQVFIVIEVIKDKDEEKESEFEYEKCFVCNKKMNHEDDRPQKHVDFSVHSKCFNCSLCSSSLESQEFVKSGSLLCNPHYAQLMNMKNSNVHLRGDLLALLVGVPKKVYYKVAIMTKPGISAFPPFLTYPAVYEKDNNFREFLLTKIINAERVSMNATDFRTRSKRTRKVFLDGVCKKENLQI
eukprot:TRINITY_DN8747_c0_g1_i1.p1 TRINITY_DN8747_c0_g1~~TRINITY_DN8747_c0_g1_i1.p1  ORF type:complete len:484 (-),score=118.23 TRINITY_DN8747_c0_g1_i1:28-1479(-)